MAARIRLRSTGCNMCQLLEIPTPFRLQNSRVLLLEPAGSCAPDLGKRLLEGTYDKPFILDQGALRFLQFDLERVQSLMRRDDPDALCLRYTRKMMTFLLFNPQPRRILIVGLGGGSLAKFCYRCLPSATITAVEIDPDVMALREEFRVRPDDARFRVLQCDGVEYITQDGPRRVSFSSMHTTVTAWRPNLPLRSSIATPSVA